MIQSGGYFHYADQQRPDGYFRTDITENAERTQNKCLYCHTLVLPSWLCSVTSSAILRASGSLIIFTNTASNIKTPAKPK